MLQECVPVGCVPLACWPYPSMHWAGGVYPSMHWAGGCISACTGQEGVYPSMHWAGGCIPACTGQGVCIPACTGRGGGVYQHALGRRVSILACPGGCLPRGVSAKVGVSAGGVAAPPETIGRHLPMDRMTDRCKNVTLPQLRCGR